MNILLLSTSKPYNGSGSGLTEYAYQLISNLKPMLKRKDKIEYLYALEAARRNDIWGLLEVNTKFKNKIKGIPKEKYNIIHITNQEIGFAAKILKKSGSRARVITTIHDLSRLEKGLHNGLFQKAYNRLIRRSIKDTIKYSDYILCDSSQTDKTITEKFGEMKNINVVSLGTSDKIINSPIKKAIKGTTFEIGYIGALMKHKNVTFILNAAKHLREKDYKIRIYGTGIDKKMLESFGKSHGLDNVYLVGYLNENRKALTYDSFDAFVFPSLYEGFGLPILEAQVRGLPVIIYKYGKIPKEVRKYCLEAESSEHMAQIIEGLKENGYNEKLRKKAAEYARSFTWEKTARETLKVYRKVLR